MIVVGESVFLHVREGGGDQQRLRQHSIGGGAPSGCRN